MENMTWPEFFNSFDGKRTEQCEKCEFFNPSLNEVCSQCNKIKEYHVGVVEPTVLHACFDCVDFLAKKLGHMTIEEQKEYGKHPGKEGKMGTNSEQQSSKGVQ